MTFGGLDSLFNPAKRHMDEEKQRLQSTREEVGDASGGKRIDLDSGRVKLGRRRKGARAGQDAVPAQRDADAGEPAVETAASSVQGRRAGMGLSRSTGSAGREESAAAQRARQRRGKAGAG